MYGRVLCLAVLVGLSLCKATVFTSEEDAEFYRRIRIVNRNINDAITNALISLQANMSVGFPQFGIPPLDPFHLDEASFSFNEPIAKLDGNVRNLDIKHLSEFVVDMVKANLLMLKVDVDISLHLLEASGEYKLDGIISNVLPVYGEGHFEASVKDIKLSVNVKLGVKDGYVSIRTLSLDVSFADVAANIENLLGGGDLGDTINQIINDMGPTLFEQVKPIILGMASDKLINLANEQLSDVTLQDILGSIGMRKLRALHAEMGLL